MVFKISSTYIPESHLLVLIKIHYDHKYYITLQKQRQRPTYGGLLLLCWPWLMRNGLNVLLSIYTDETLVLILYLSGKQITYMTIVVVLNYSIQIEQFIYHNFHISRRSVEHKSYTEGIRRYTTCNTVYLLLYRLNLSI